MDAERLNRILRRRLAADIPDSVNLWPEIRRRVQADAPRPRVRLRPRHALVMAAVVALATTAYAVFQLIAPPDPGMEAVSGQVTHINRTQQVESLSRDFTNVSITLATAYADANRINLTYAFSGDTDASGTTLFINPTMSDAAGTVYGFLSAGRGTEDAQDGSTYFQSGTLSFDASQVTGAPSELALNVLIDVAYTNDNLRAADPNAMMMAAQAEFAIVVPFDAGKTVAVEQTADANGVAVTLHRAVITPSLTRLEMCLSDRILGAADWWLWSIKGSVSINGEVAVSDEAFTLGSAQAPCFAAFMPHALAHRGGAWTVTLAAFTAETGARVVGPWTFTFAVP